MFKPYSLDCHSGARSCASPESITNVVDGFTRRYDVDKLVWFEVYDDVLSAIAREKELKKWRRDWKIRLIEEQNPNWMDLYPVLSG
jgi:putative endonuclease